jgi:predicted small secreted protein
MVFINVRIIRKWIWIKRLPMIKSVKNTFKYKWKILGYYNVVQEDYGNTWLDTFWSD